MQKNSNKGLQVNYLEYDDLHAGDKQDVSDNGCGKDYATYMHVELNGKTLMMVSDAIEPEDATFGRDLNWIGGLLEQVYQAGLNQHKLEGAK